MDAVGSDALEHGPGELDDEIGVIVHHLVYPVRIIVEADEQGFRAHPLADGTEETHGARDAGVHGEIALLEFPGAQIPGQRVPGGRGRIQLLLERAEGLAVLHRKAVEVGDRAAVAGQFHPDAAPVFLDDVLIVLLDDLLAEYRVDIGLDPHRLVPVEPEINAVVRVFRISLGVPAIDGFRPRFHLAVRRTVGVAESKGLMKALAFVHGRSSCLAILFRVRPFRRRRTTPKWGLQTASIDSSISEETLGTAPDPLRPPGKRPSSTHP